VPGIYQNEERKHRPTLFCEVGAHIQRKLRSPIRHRHSLDGEIRGFSKSALTVAKHPGLERKQTTGTENQYYGMQVKILEIVERVCILKVELSGGQTNDEQS
jgi:hypothetical protein